MGRNSWRKRGMADGEMDGRWVEGKWIDEEKDSRYID